MKTRHSSQGISRAAAEQLLDGRTATELVLDGQIVSAVEDKGDYFTDFG